MEIPKSMVAVTAVNFAMLIGTTYLTAQLNLKTDGDSCSTSTSSTN
ncbi:hypothetical protein MHSWG343_05270 [Candidatus Mycoplasma haematohominis]|uniref:Uncharacterized protein n=1 Tax=Candidatus Mycoplasma haematohominis TaxID=1494318 RepID=A0A478FU16_9MOLU|nr:hypothetical protein MHSWG343_05270 [Candidatus Mycoplasma haemohominis]